MSDIELQELEEAIEQLQSMPSETVTDADKIPSQSTVPDFGSDVA